MATTRIPELKLILCGEYGAGKSSIFRRFTNNTFVASNDRSSTLGLDHFSKVYRCNEKESKVLASTDQLNAIIHKLTHCRDIFSCNYGTLVAWNV